MQTEEWKTIPEWPNYQASTLGRIRRIDGVLKNGRHWKGRVLKQKRQSNGYMSVMLSENGVTKTKLVHRLIAETFLDNENKYPVVNHKDRNQANNVLDNLEYCTQSYNSTYKDAHIERSKKFLKPVLQFSIDGTFIREWSSATEVKNKLGYEANNIRACCRGVRTKANDFKWQYK